MKTVGIIAEYNPFHTGHKYQLDQIRQKLHADYIVIAMSGDFCAAGHSCPFFKACAYQDGFILRRRPGGGAACFCFHSQCRRLCKGAVHLLSGLGVTDVLCFGSESTDTQLFMELARILLREPEPYRQLLTKNLKDGLSFPAARSNALTLYTHNPQLATLLSKPNTILGIEYCKAILSLNSSIHPYALQREGSGYHDTDLSDTFPSASGIRAQLFKEPLACFQDLIPSPSFSIFKKAIEEGLYLKESDLDPLYRYRLLLETPDSLQQYLDMNEDLARRICTCAWEYSTFTEFAAKVKTKNMTQAHAFSVHCFMPCFKSGTLPAIFIMHAFLVFVRPAAQPSIPNKKRGSMPLLSKAADVQLYCCPLQKIICFRKLFLLPTCAQTMLSQKTGQPFIHEYSQPVVVL